MRARTRKCLSCHRKMGEEDQAQMRTFPAGHPVRLEVGCDAAGERLLSRASLCKEDPWETGVRTGWGGGGNLQAR